MITRFAKEIGTILMIAPARRAPTLTLMISNRASTYCYFSIRAYFSLSSGLPDPPVAIAYADGLWFASGRGRRLLGFIGRAIAAVELSGCLEAID
jgi:hypothetical protein